MKFKYLYKIFSLAFAFFSGADFVEGDYLMAGVYAFFTLLLVYVDMEQEKKV